MSKILELYEKRTSTWEAAKAILESKRDKDGFVSAEDAAVYEKMEADVVNIGKEIGRLERQTAMDAELAKATTTPILTTPVKFAEEKTGRASEVYKQAFWNKMRNRSYADVSNALQVGVDSEGGFLAPDEYEKQLIDGLEEENIMRSMATVISTSSGDRKIPVVSSKGSASWVDEEAAIPESDDSFGQLTLGAYKCATLIKVSNELLNDSAFNLESYISSQFARRIGAKEEEAFLIGDGTGKPTGLFTDNGGQTNTTSSSSSNITFDNVMDLYYALKAPYRKKGVFLCNESTVKALRKLKDNNQQYLWSPAIAPGQPDTILGRPIKTSAFIPTIAAGAKVLAFGDYSFYWIADRQGRHFRRLGELFAVTDQTGFLATERVDGKLILPEAVQLLSMASA